MLTFNDPEGDKNYGSPAERFDTRYEVAMQGVGVIYAVTDRWDALAWALGLPLESQVGR